MNLPRKSVVAPRLSMLPLRLGSGSEPVDPILVVSAPSRERLSVDRGRRAPEDPAVGTVKGMVFMLQGKITMDELPKLGTGTGLSVVLFPPVLGTTR